MSLTDSDIARPRRTQLDHGTAMQRAATEYQRVAELLRSLASDDWTTPTNCPPWDVRAMAAHLLGMAEMAASLREQRRQVKAATNAHGVFIDALTALQVDERTAMAPGDIVTRYEAVAPKAVRGRRRAPGFIRGRAMPQTQRVGGRDETWTIGYLLDTILTRDPWMHRIDICDATGAPLVLTAEHDGVIVDDIVREWAGRHGQPFVLRLTGPAGGSWANGSGPELECDVASFCRALARRAPASGLLATEVPF
ncbi:MAG TPA: maleylpyruvate isomerase family mycothiol-dependent enzyme [Jatrophihabitantaceae bacterium]|jgi:uncharacterized protein (TIGR03083 family)|nr:maleylpyruvate isomerase family mycothiol-dependent enzyme [Jatrophihabitantaceae bacterium]